MSETRLGMAILAAGQSRRFGTADKLAAPLWGTTLGERVAHTVGAAGFHMASVICSIEAHPCEPGWRACGFEPVVNAEAEQGMGTSVALAARLAIEAECDKLLIALADMPLVPATHYLKLILAAGGPDAVITSAIGETRMPPAAFGRSRFPALAQLGGDEGARGLLAQGKICPCPPEWLIDVDTPETLADLQKRFKSPS